MKTIETDLEQDCEDTVFALCDIRERYPGKCADEFGRCLQLATQINNAPVIMKHSEPLQHLVITDAQKALFNQLVPRAKRSEDQKTSKLNLDTMLNTVKNLKTVADQMKRSEDCTIDNILKKTDKNHQTS